MGGYVHRLRLPRLVALSLASLTCLLCVGSAAADQNITVTPSSTSLSIAPGGTASNHFDVINNGSADFSVAATILPYHVSGVSYDPQFTLLPGMTDASQWVSFTGPTTQQLGSNKLTSFNYTVTVPQGTAPGGYYAVLFATTTPENTTTGGVVAHNRVGNIMYMTVTGPVHSSGFLHAATTHHFVIGTGTTFGVLVGNNGGVHFTTNSNMVVTNTFGKTVYNYKAERIILPGTQRLIMADWSTRAPIGIYHLKRSATLPSGAASLPSQTIVVIQPWLGIVLLLVIALGIGWILRLVVRKPRE